MELKPFPFLSDDDGFESDDRADSPSVPSTIRSGASHIATAAAASGGADAAAAAAVGGYDPDEPVLFQVVATHPYVREDDDELTFHGADIINVLPHEDDDPDDGWLFG